MASAIWSASLDAIRSFPALTLIRFFDNHGLLSLTSQPTWKVVARGSGTYIPKLTAQVSGDIHEGAAIQSVSRSEAAVTVAFRDRPSMTFDDVVFACHGDQVLPLLADATDCERDVFSGFTTTTNVAWLHTDASVLPVRPPARASWNYLLAAETGAPPMVTYDLNRLQRLREAEQVLRDAQPGWPNRRAPRLAPVRLRSPAVHPGGHRRAAAVGRGERRQPHAFLRRLLVLRLSRGRVELGGPGGSGLRGEVVIDSGLFVGTLRHRRFAPVSHAFTYPLFMALLDIDRVPQLMRASRVTSYNRWNWASFDERDHFGDPSLPLRVRLALDAKRHGVNLPDGPIFLLTHLRYLGYCFNPVSLFYCFGRDERLQLVLAEVRNTFGGSHNYWLRPDPDSRTFRASRREVALRVAVPAGRHGLRVRPHGAGGPPRGAHGNGEGGVCMPGRDPVARAAAVERRGDSPSARPASRYDGECDGRDSLAGAEAVVEGRARGASPHGRRGGRAEGQRSRGHWPA